MVSSAYSLTVDEIPDEMSFTYKMNKTGPRIVPWGTPDKTGDQDELRSLGETRGKLYTLYTSPYRPYKEEPPPRATGVYERIYRFYSK